MLALPHDLHFAPAGQCNVGLVFCHISYRLSLKVPLTDWPYPSNACQLLTQWPLPIMLIKCTCLHLIMQRCTTRLIGLTEHRIDDVLLHTGLLNQV